MQPIFSSAPLSRVQPLLTVTLTAALSACASAPEPKASPGGSSGESSSGIPKVVADNPRLSTLSRLLADSELSAELARGGPYTVFAPTDAAFAEVSQKLAEATEHPAQLRALLSHHVTAGRQTKSELAETTRFTTLGGHEVPVEQLSGRVRVGNAMVEGPPIVADNGLVYVIDHVLAPPPGALDAGSQGSEGSKTTGRKGGPDAWWW